ncbi:hypothetical protein NDU88_010185 [Pleurodeles waltl]|uniref:Uncharacterized protein n=1 Tax=Pleurodeles waltl TaxID=8319 RepID=A0AAV7S376_PLEWA|nr:hypothetical protein NDU88_010185 [Pleurodeles waltl]
MATEQSVSCQRDGCRAAAPRGVGGLTRRLQKSHRGSRLHNAGRTGLGAAVREPGELVPGAGAEQAGLAPGSEEAFSREVPECPGSASVPDRRIQGFLDHSTAPGVGEEALPEPRSGTFEITMTVFII